MRLFLRYGFPSLLVALVLGGCGTQVQQRSHTDVLPLEPGDRIGQTVAPSSGAVSGVDVLVATYGAQVSGALTLAVTAADGGEVASGTVAGEDLPDNGWAGVRFEEPIAAGAAMALQVEWDGSGPIGVYANVPPGDLEPQDVTAGERLLNDPYAGGELLRDGAPAPGDLAFRLAGGGAGWSLVRAAAARLATGLRATPVFTAVWVLSLIASAALAFGGLRRGQEPGGQPDPGELHERRPDEQQHEREEAGAQQTG